MKLFPAHLWDRAADASIFFSFDRSGFLRHREDFVPGDLDVDLAGKRCLVTGANSGLGRSAAHALAGLGAEVWLLCRSRTRGGVAERDIRDGTGNQAVRLELVDMASRRSILDLAECIGDLPVDVLIHNAGVLPERRVETEDGLELTWATNVIGPFLLTWKLLPNLRAAPGARVIHVSSGGMYTQRLDLRDVHRRRAPFDGVVAYAQTKRAEVILNELWAQHPAAAGILFHSMHPGWADTPGVRSSLPKFWRFTKNRLRTPREGADTIVWLAACERLGTDRELSDNGLFWFDRRPVPTHLMRRTRERPGDRDRLWRLCLEQAGIEDDEPGSS